MKNWTRVIAMLIIVSWFASDMIVVLHSMSCHHSSHTATSESGEKHGSHAHVHEHHGHVCNHHHSHGSSEQSTQEPSPTHDSDSCAICVMKFSIRAACLQSPPVVLEIDAIGLPMAINTGDDILPSVQRSAALLRGPPVITVG